MRLIDADAFEVVGTIIPNGIDVKSYVMGMEYILNKIDSMPTIEERKWIPCSERLPDKLNVYTVTNSKGDVVRFVYTGTDSSREYWLRCAKAWMPLPEPWKGESNDRT